MESSKRLSKQQLISIDKRLGERDRLVLESIRKCRYLTTDQIQKLFFKNSSCHTAALRAANRMLVKLNGFELIAPLKRRIGGVRAGSGSYVWDLDEAGARLLNLNRQEPDVIKRKRIFEPSPRFLEHTLAVAEIYIRLNQIADKHENIRLMKAEMEPDCWRMYIGALGSASYLKPDIYAVTTDGQYEDHWFFEIDLDTEAPIRIIRKCQQYCKYFLSGTEQKIKGVFPLVVWIVPDQKRADSIRSHIMQEPFLERKDIFLIVTTDLLEKLICEGDEVIRHNALKK